MEESEWIDESTVSPHVKEAKYAVRGELVLRAMEIEKKLLANPEAFPFDKVVYCNIGNPHQLGQKPLTFPRQVLALLACPELIKNERLGFLCDVVERAQKYLDKIPGGIGAYSNSQGLEIVRHEVAAFLEQRDGYPSHIDNIFLTNGASAAVVLMVSLMLKDKHDALMIPIPQYPLYSASIALQGGTVAGYYLDESSGWSCSSNALQDAYNESVRNGARPRGIVVMNPGNPTGQVFSVEELEAILRFANKNRLVVFADEVYQTNIYSSSFVSFRKVLLDIQTCKRELLDQQLITLHSVSKGFTGECGLRGGFMELIGFDESVKLQVYKLLSIMLCSNLVGQVAVGLMVNPPRQGSPSYQLYEKERSSLISSLKRRAEKIVSHLNELDGVRCSKVSGALYTFPSITLPEKAVKKAESIGIAPDAFYCMELLNNCGIVCVPGSGFGQVDGTFHFRTTILPAEEDLDSVLEAISTFHKNFMSIYR
jgi:alanine transaminase